LYQSTIFFNGKAIQGESIKGKYYDRIVYYSKDYQGAINFLNKDKSISTYVLPLPAIEYGNYSFDNGEHHVGQDLLPKMIDKPFVYLSLSNGMSVKSYRQLKKIIDRKNYKEVKNFPIKYIVLRKDITCADCPNLSEKEIGNELKKVYQNKTFTIYKFDFYSPIISSQNSLFTVVNPIKYKIQLRNVSKPRALSLLSSFNKDWKIFITKKSSWECVSEVTHKSLNSKECVAGVKFFEGEELSYLWKKPIFQGTHKLYNGYANTWTINSDYIKENFNNEYYSTNKDGSINFQLIIYYKPQSWYYLFMLISLVTIVLLSAYLIRKNK